MDRRVKELVLHMDSCKQCIRLRREVNAAGNYDMVCRGDPFEPRVFTEAENDAIRDGAIFIPLWCPLPDADGTE
jgi:hypothetical protein